MIFARHSKVYNFKNTMFRYNVTRTIYSIRDLGFRSSHNLCPCIHIKSTPKQISNVRHTNFFD